jgi:N-terminal acetyltransferase B complex non-catalytic subunit
MEHVRMRVFHEPVNTDLTDMELIELKFIFARRESIRYTFQDGVG